MSPLVSWLLVLGVVAVGIAVYWTFMFWVARLLDYWWAWRYLRPRDRAGSVEQTITEIRELPTTPEPTLYDQEKTHG